MFKRTTAINKMLSMRARKKVVQGGTSAGKTFGILPILINKALSSAGTEISVVSESIPHLRRGALKDFLKIMVWTKRMEEKKFNRSLLTYRFDNGSYIEFFSADQPDKLRGARRNVLYINEANNVDFESYQQLAIRTSHDIWLDFNPTAEFWAHTEVLKDDDAELLILNYKDNEALPDTIVKEIEKAKDKAKTSKYWDNWWKVYGLGQIGSLQGVVFENWETIDTLPNDAKLIAYGMDFGFTNDPTTLTGIYQYDGKYILDEIIYRTKLTTSDLNNLMKAKGVSKNKSIYADSAEPKTIRELNNMGWVVKASEKGRDSINFGIQKMQQEDFLVTKNSTNLIKELRSYLWDTDKTGQKLNKPIDAFNHAIDGVRYYFTTKDKFTGKYTILK